MNETNAKKLLFTVADILEDTGVEFFLSLGTCLGACREKRFIEIDEDIDLGILRENLLPKAQIISNQFIKKELQIKVIDRRHKEPWDGSIYGIKFNGYGEHGDIGGFMKIQGKRAIPSHIGNFWFVHTARFLEELGEIEFYGRNFKIPKDSDGYLTEIYGNWRTPIKRFADCRWLCRKSESWRENA